MKPERDLDQIALIKRNNKFFTPPYTHAEGELLHWWRHWVSSLDYHEDLETFRDFSTRIIAKVTSNLRRLMSNALYPSNDFPWEGPVFGITCDTTSVSWGEEIPTSVGSGRRFICGQESGCAPLLPLSNEIYHFYVTAYALSVFNKLRTDKTTFVLNKGFWGRLERAARRLF